MPRHQSIMKFELQLHCELQGCSTPSFPFTTAPTKMRLSEVITVSTVVANTHVAGALAPVKLSEEITQDAQSQHDSFEIARRVYADRSSTQIEHVVEIVRSGAEHALQVKGLLYWPR